MLLRREGGTGTGTGEGKTSERLVAVGWLVWWWRTQLEMEVGEAEAEADLLCPRPFPRGKWCGVGQRHAVHGGGFVAFRFRRLAVLREWASVSVFHSIYYLAFL